MTPLATYLTCFFSEHLPRERGASRNTIESYAYTFELLVAYVARRVGRRPSQLTIEDFSSKTILEFLKELEDVRENSAQTRNVRLAAIKCFFRYLEFMTPSCLDLARSVGAITSKKFMRKSRVYLERDEIQALLDAPDTSTRLGIRDRAMLYIAYAGGLRVSEMVGLRCEDLDPEIREIRVLGKGRKERILVLWKQARPVLREWLRVRPGLMTGSLFLNACGHPMTRHGFAHRLKVNVAIAQEKVPSLRGRRVSPHVLRHTCAMHTLDATNGDVRKVAAFLGHESVQSTEIYLHHDPAVRLEIFSSRVPPEIQKGTFENESDRVMEILRRARFQTHEFDDRE